MTTKKTRAELAKLTAEERIEYDKALNRQRVQKYREANKDKEKYKAKHKAETYKYQKENREAYNKLNAKHNKTYRANKKAVEKADIVDRKGKKIDTEELKRIRRELRNRSK